MKTLRTALLLLDCVGVGSGMVLEFHICLSSRNAEVPTLRTLSHGTLFIYNGGESHLPKQRLRPREAEWLNQ